MAGTGLHRGLEMRLVAFATRIADLRRKLARAEGLEKTEISGEIDELERRYKMLGDQLRRLDQEGPGFRQDMKAEIEKSADDLTGAIEDFIMWIDRGYRPDQRPKRLHKS